MLTSSEGVELRGKSALAELVRRMQDLQSRLNARDLNALRSKDYFQYEAEMRMLARVLKEFNDLQDRRKEGHRHEMAGLRDLYNKMNEKEDSEDRAREQIFVPKRPRTEQEEDLFNLVTQFKELLNKYTDQRTDGLLTITWSQLEQMPEEERSVLQADIDKAKSLEKQMQGIRETLWIDYPGMKSKVEKLLGMLKALD